MSALAKFLLACGYEVSGSDMNSGEQTEELLFSGVKIHFGAKCRSSRFASGRCGNLYQCDSGKS